VMFSHNHTDHASLVQEIKRACGAALIIHEVQIPYLAELEAYHKRKGEPYVPVRVEKGDLVVSGASPRIPAAVGLRGWVVPTPGHSADHISLVLEDGKAFTGDLPPAAVGQPGADEIEQSWKRLAGLGAARFYPAHGEPFTR
jgi:endoribonuclease LACTB2